jgi:hypothetical protein
LNFSYGEVVSLALASFLQLCLDMPTFEAGAAL